ncbi:hypothetical protein [Roseburia sp. AM16-25]|uniref:hypothetical protein n=1 Tax=Roseburia sp. AM16-25 TaxID=2292065 RepID=UPI000E522928|nr:hypothetical protein [Roseburia sp. AM16-25]RHO30852.1 hypothetical protein DW183_09350 [Roseburia sp. AM16-25]
MNYIVDKKKVGAYLKKLVKESQYSSNRQFGKEYLKMMGYTQPDDIEINRMNNRLSQIFNGKKGIQMEDMLTFSDLLGVSCEEILSAGERRVPVSSHMTNYRIAFSQDEELWSSYMKREDKLFLNSDEYGKTVIDYAIEFKNYPFIKWLLDEEFIWLVDNSEYRQFGYSYGGGTSIEKRAPWDMDNAVPLQVKYDDQLRLKIITLALENEDYDVLDEFRARETPFLHRVGYLNDRDDAYQYYNEDYIHAIANASDNVLEYFAKEFELVSNLKWKSQFIYPFLGEVIEVLVENHQFKKAEFLAQHVLTHNQNTYEQVESLINIAYTAACDEWGDKLTEDLKRALRLQIPKQIEYSEKNRVVSFFDSMGKDKTPICYATNIVRVKVDKTKSPIKDVLLEINMWYDRVAALKETWGCE